eukprot:TRINITY_DN7403_c0_g1_i3.p1 TRINITY_DN7403_c0_g1~~TRINITY_DN7403_c0_g1_i3.p1  ORF type:complete len:633 (-),score=91.76 TRINITY_DN7403_c0_g1_i3:446-2257(-)
MLAPLVRKNRHLLQSDTDLQKLCSVESDMKGAFVVFNELLLKNMCDRSSEVCKDVEPQFSDPSKAYTCEVVVEQGLCDDPFIVRSNYCAKSCKRCKEGICKTTLAGCKCLNKWTYDGSGQGQEFEGCANPDKDPQGPWCFIDTSTCMGSPNGKDADYCDPLCQTNADTVAVAEAQDCEMYGEKCSNECEGKDNIQEIKCYGLDKDARECVCKQPNFPDIFSTKPPNTGTMSVPIVASNPQQLDNGQVEGSCYDFLPRKEGTCADRVEWGSCSESWMSEKFYCAISCEMCDDALSARYDCLPEFEACYEQCDGVDNIQEFACFRELQKSECDCSKEVKRLSAGEDDFVIEECSDFLPAKEGTCQQRKEWGSCSEGWMIENNYCALTCGYCAPTQGKVGEEEEYIPDLGRSVLYPLQGSSSTSKDPNTVEAPIAIQDPTQSPSSGASIIGVLTYDMDTFSVFTGTSKERDFLQAHNAVRKAHCIPDLKWSYQLALEAQLWSDKCILSRDPISEFGQNLYYSFFSGKPSADDIVAYWYEEAEPINYKNLPPISKETTTLYQLLWAETTSVGCGITECGKDLTVVVCAYDPRGNDPKTLLQNIQGPC